MHLFLNHVPVVGGIGALLLLAWGLLRRSTDVTLAALVALVAVGVITVPVFLTGTAARDRIEHLPGMTAERLDHHEEEAIAAIVGLEAAAAIAFAALFAWCTTRRYPMFPAVAALVVGIAASLLILRAASSGGKIRHGEIRTVEEAAIAVPK